MMPIPAAAAVTAWKRQIDLGLELAQAVVTGMEKACELQRDAARQTYESLEAARNALATTSPAELAALQTRLATENLGRMAQYWGALAANARDTHARIVERLMRGAAATPWLTDAAAAPQPTGALNDLVDAGYRQWLETLRRFYSPPEIARPG
jgi:phasin family protein